MNLYRIMQLEAEKLEREIDDLENRIRKAPQGALRCHRHGNSFKWYLVDDKAHQKTGKNVKRKYISKRNGRPLAEKLARKAFDKKKLANYKKELKAMKSYLHLSTIEKSPEQVYLTEKPGYRELLLSDMPLLSRELEEWKAETYKKNPFLTDNLKIRSTDGLLVRSKSESMICSELSLNEIPYRYECELEIEGMIFYPDFTIRHPSTGKEFIWEHFGMIDQEDYLEKALKKIRIYLRNGYIPGKNLIMTFETREEPLGYDTVMQIIMDYFT